MKHSKEFKLEAVQAYLSSEDVGKKRVAAIFNVDRKQLREWFYAYKAYGEEALEVRTSQQNYSAEFKQSVLEHKWQQGLSASATALLFNIPSSSTIRAWEQRYNQGDINAFVERRGRPKKMKNTEDPDQPNTQNELVCQHYSSEFKLSVLEHKLQQGLSLSETAALFNIPSSSTIYVWEQRYNQGGTNAFVDRRGRPKKMKNTEDSDQPITSNEPACQPTHAALLREIEYLKAENAYLKKLDALIREKRLQQRTKPKSSQD